MLLSTPVERFVRDVLPSVPGPRQWPANPSGLNRIRAAAKDRGLAERTVGNSIYFFDGHLEVVGWLQGPHLTSLTGKPAVTICDSKDLTRDMLQTVGLPIPRGIVLSPDQFDEALAHVLAQGPSVLKPSCGKQGKGVTCGIETEEDLRTAWESAGAAVREKPPLFLLEELVQGIDIRALVIGRCVVAATTRLPALVVGDGNRTIAELVELKQRRRRIEHPSLAKRPLTVDSALLSRNGKSLGDVPTNGEVVVLQGAANVSAGGESVDVTDLIHPDLSNLAVSAVKAIPELHLAGVDLISREIGSADDAVVLEVNARPEIELHYYPFYGKSRHVAGAIVDEMLATAGVRPVRSKIRRSAQRVARAGRRRFPGKRR